MKCIDLDQARQELSQLVDDAASGVDVVICRAGEPLARLTRLAGLKRRVRFGLLKGQLSVPANFDEPLADDVLPGFQSR